MKSKCQIQKLFISVGESEMKDDKRVLKIYSDVCQKLNLSLEGIAVGAMFRCVFDGVDGFSSIDTETIAFLEMEDMSKMNEFVIEKTIKEHVFFHLKELERAVQVAKVILLEEKEMVH